MEVMLGTPPQKPIKVLAMEVLRDIALICKKESHWILNLNIRPPH
jgi:hypothetical protein